MESLQGPIDSCFLDEHVDIECLTQGFVNKELAMDEEEELLMPNLEDKMSFLEMLQSVEYPPFFINKEPTFQTLLKLQHLTKPWQMSTAYLAETESPLQATTLEHESCVTHDIANLQSPVKSESQDLQNSHSNSCPEGASPVANNQRLPARNSGGVSSFTWSALQHTILADTHISESSLLAPRERRKRKRTRPDKNKEEVESQRMTHIAVERNRRRQMNDHLNSLRSLMPPSYVQRGDQASIVGGAIDFVKELEQLLHSLEAQKRIRKTEEAEAAIISIASDGRFDSEPVCGSNSENESRVKRKSNVAEIEVTVMHSHVNLKIQCQRKPGQLLRAIVALEELRLTVLHLSVTSSEPTVLYSFNLKIEEDCKLGSADDIAASVDQIFSIINGS